MNIQSINNDYNVSMYGVPPKNGAKKFWNKIKQKALNTLPNKTFKDGENNVMGASAILTQPVIDYYNHRVDDETRTVSRNRTIAKIVAGTFVGAIVRGFVHKGVIKMTDINGLTKKSQLLLPKKYINKMKENPVFLKNYQSTISTSLAILIMSLATNFLLDAPLTMHITNYLNSKSKVCRKDKEEVANG